MKIVHRIMNIIHGYKCNPSCPRIFIYGFYKISKNGNIRVFVIVYITNVKLRPHVATYHNVAALPTSKRPIQLFAFFVRAPSWHSTCTGLRR